MTTDDQTYAERLADNPSAEVIDAQKELVSASKASESLATREFREEVTEDNPGDGSVLIVYSFQGSESKMRAFGPDEDPVIAVPRLPDSPPPEGVQDDGTNTYDETGPPQGLAEGEAV